MEFLKFFGVFLLVSGAAFIVTGVLPYPVLLLIVLVVIGIGVHHHRNRGLA